MGAVPKHKISSQRQGKRRRAITLKRANGSLCPECHQPRLPHRACPHCGFYRKKTAPTTAKK